MIKLRYMITVLLISSVALFTGCNDKSSVDKEMIEKERTNAINELNNASTLIENEMKEIETRLGSMEGEAVMASRRHLRTLDSLNIEAEKHMNRISEIPEEEWDDFKSDMNDLLGDIEEELAAVEYKVNPQN